MSDLIKLGKKVFTVGVVLTTILWSVGVSVLVSDVANAATTLTAGQNFKVSGKAAIYYWDGTVSRYYPSSDVWYTYYDSYKYKVTLSEADAKTYVGSTPTTYPGLVGFNPRSNQLVYTNGMTNSLYVLGNDYYRYEIDATAAAALYGTGYAKLAKEVSTADWANYKTATTKVTGATPTLWSGAFFAMGGKYYVATSATAYSEVSATGLSANRLNKTKAVTATSANLTGFTAGATAVSAVDKTLSEPVVPAGTVATTTPPVATGALTVGLASDNPVGTTLADGTAYNSLLKLNLTASSAGQVKVSGVTVTKTGIISNTNVTGVSVWDKAGVRHGDVMTSLTSEGKVTISFATNPIIVAAGTTETLTVKVNLGSGTNSGLVGMSLGASTDVTADGTVSGTFPLTGGSFSIIDGGTSLAGVSTTVQTVAGSSDGTLAANANVEIGNLQKEIGKFRFTEANGYEDMKVESITFYLEGTAQDKDLKNFTVYAPDNTVLGTATAAVDRYVTVKFTSPYTVAKSTYKDLTLKADIVDGSTRYFRVNVQNDYDVMVKGATTGYYVLENGFDQQRATTGWFRMKAGSLTVNKTASSTSGNISSGAQGVVLAMFDVKAVGENMELRKMGLTASSSATGGVNKQLTGNVTVRDASSKTVYLTVAGTDTNLYNGYQYNLSSYITINSGETKTLEVVGNIDSTATSVQRYTAKVGNFYAKRASSLDYADELPSSANNGTSGNQLSVNSTSLTCVKDTSMGDVTRSTGATNVVGQFICTAGTSEDVRLTAVTVSFTNGSTPGNAATNYQNLSLWDGSTQLGSTISTVASSSNSFTFDTTLTKNTSKVLQVKAYITASAANDVVTNMYSYNYSGKTSGTSDTGSTVTGQQVTVGEANVLITAVSDSTTLSKIYGPSQTGLQVGKWKLAATNDSVTLNKITFSLYNADSTANTTAGTFASFDLYNKSNVKVNTTAGIYVAGNVVFDGLSVPIAMNSYEYLTLKAATNGSGVIENAVAIMFVVKTDSNSDMEIRSSAGSLLSTTQIDGVAGNNVAESTFATSTKYIHHDAYPTMSMIALGGTSEALSLNATEKIFKFKVTNPGPVDLRMSTTTITVNVSGLASDGTSTGTMGAWKLYEDNGSGGLGTQLAATSSVGFAGAAAATSSIAVDGWTTGSSLNVIFNSNTDNSLGNLFDNLLIPANSDRTFILTANTNGILNGKTSGIVSVYAEISGSTGYGTSAWNTGNFNYFYTPSGGTEEGAYSNSDSYSVTGNTLKNSSF